MPSFTERVRKVFDVDMQEAGLMGLERLVWFRGCLVRQGVEIAHTMAVQAAIQTQAGQIGFEKLARDGQQVIQRQQQHPAQFDRDGFLRPGQRRRQLMRGVRAVLKAGPPPAINGVERYPVTAC